MWQHLHRRWGRHPGAVTWVQVHWLTLGANLVPASAKLFLQLPEIETVAYAVNMTVRRRQCIAGSCSVDLRRVPLRELHGQA